MDGILRRPPLTVDILVQHGANVSSERQNITIALHATAFHGSTMVAKYLLDHEADSNFSNGRNGIAFCATAAAA